MEEKKLLLRSKRRSVIAMLLVPVLVFALVMRLLSFQLVHGDEYLAAAQKTTVKTIPIEAPRGEIVDCRGRALAVNRTVYCVQIDLVFMPAKERNDILLRLIRLMDDEGETFFDDLPVSDDFPYSFTEASDGARLRIKTALGIKETPASANNLMTLLKKRYKIPDTYTERQARRVCGVRYTMELRGASTQTPYLFAEDVSVSTVTAVKENSAVLSGCDVVTRAARQYYYSDVAPDIVGIVGLVSENELSGGYKPTDYIGKFGMEKSMESYLRGKAGEMQVTLNSYGQVISSTVTKEAIPGATVMLTLDIELQRTAGKALEAQIKSVSEAAAPKQTSGYDCTAGSLVLCDPNTGGILVAVNYPTYDLDRYFADYSALLASPGNPLYNRAMQGLYPPGSTFKPITALAALETGKITAKTTFTCHRVMTYRDRSYACTGNHGTINVITAIAKSCNIFFYQTGLSVGFTDLGTYAGYFGIGQKTGVEIAESAGSMSKSNIMMTAIGQADTLLTPLQLCSYASVLANGGTRYRSTLVKRVVSYDYRDTVLDGAPEVLSTVPYAQKNWDTVQEGLYAGSNRHMASYYTQFVDADYQIGAKTGTAQVSNGSANGMFICYAPFDKPTVALSVALEHAGGGAKCAPLARKVLDAYFGSSSDADAIPSEGIR